MATQPAPPLQLLRRCGLFQGIAPGELQKVAELVRHRFYRSGEEIFRIGESGDSMFVVARGRVKCVVEQEDGEYELLDYEEQGGHFGDLALLVGGHRTSTATAVMDTELLELSHDRFQSLMMSVPGFAANLSRSLGFKLRGIAGGRPSRRRPAVIGIVNSTLRTQALVRPLAAALVDSGDSVDVLTDRKRIWPSQGAYLVERIPGATNDTSQVAIVRERLAQVVEHNDRVLLDLTQKGIEDTLPAILEQCEEVWWLVDPLFVETAHRNLSHLLASHSKLASRIHLVWILRHSERFPPTTLYALGVNPLDFKIVLDDNTDDASLEQRKSITRLVRHLHGTRIGLALGGGGARGLAHLGVLRALDRAGIFFDHIAGTSVGALLGASYAAGWTPENALDHFARELTPPWLVRKLPTGNGFYMWCMFMLNGWDRKLRPYLHQYMMEQFRIPICTVAVDLVSGSLVVRDRGDAVNAIVESINLPGVSRPILRDGMALIDGGVLNNVPGDLLVERGTEMVVGVDVVTKLSQQFAGNTPDMETSQMRRAGPIETLLRVNEVQNYGITAMRSGAIDFMISPDTSKFEFADFSRAYELAEVGEAAAELAIPRLRELIADHERRPQPIAG